MTGNFNIRDNNWDFLYPHYPVHTNTLREIIDSFNLELLGTVHTRVEVCRMDLEMSGLVEQPWLQLMCCAICLPRGRNFR